MSKLPSKRCKWRKQYETYKIEVEGVDVPQANLSLKGCQIVAVVEAKRRPPEYKRKDSAREERRESMIAVITGV